MALTAAATKFEDKDFYVTKSSTSPLLGSSSTDNTKKRLSFGIKAILDNDTLVVGELDSTKKLLSNGFPFPIPFKTALNQNTKRKFSTEHERKHLKQERRDMTFETNLSDDDDNIATEVVPLTATPAGLTSTTSTIPTTMTSNTVIVKNKKRLDTNNNTSLISPTAVKRNQNLEEEELEYDKSLSFESSKSRTIKTISSFNSYESLPYNKDLGINTRRTNTCTTSTPSFKYDDITENPDYFRDIFPTDSSFYYDCYYKNLLLVQQQQQQRHQNGSKNISFPGNFEQEEIIYPPLPFIYQQNHQVNAYHYCTGDPSMIKYDLNNHKSTYQNTLLHQPIQQCMTNTKTNNVNDGYMVPPSIINPFLWSPNLGSYLFYRNHHHPNPHEVGLSLSRSRTRDRDLGLVGSIIEEEEEEKDVNNETETEVSLQNYHQFKSSASNLTDLTTTTTSTDSSSRKTLNLSNLKNGQKKKFSVSKNLNNRGSRNYENDERGRNSPQSPQSITPLESGQQRIETNYSKLMLHQQLQHTESECRAISAASFLSSIPPSSPTNHQGLMMTVTPPSYENINHIIKRENAFLDPYQPRRIGHPYQNRNPPKRKKPRTSFSRLQICELEKRFLRQKYLASSERANMAHLLKMSDAQVKTWFQNRRTKWRRQTAEERELERQATNKLIIKLQNQQQHMNQNNHRSSIQQYTSTTTNNKTEYPFHNNNNHDGVNDKKSQNQTNFVTPSFGGSEEMVEKTNYQRLQNSAGKSIPLESAASDITTRSFCDDNNNNQNQCIFHHQIVVSGSTDHPVQHRQYDRQHTPHHHPSCLKFSSLESMTNKTSVIQCNKFQSLPYGFGQYNNIIKSPNNNNDKNFLKSANSTAIITTTCRDGTEASPFNIVKSLNNVISTFIYSH